MAGIEILIVDDEQPARKKIKSLLELEEGIASVFEADNGFDAVKVIRSRKPDLVFLDIQMPGMNGFEVLEAVGEDIMPAVVFVTAYDSYAIDAFDIQAVDYLLKPFDQERFRRSLRRALSRIRESADRASVYTRLMDEIHRGKGCLQRILVSVGSRHFFVPVSDILFLTSEDKYVKLHTAGEAFLVRGTMNRMEERLDPSNFVRIHRSTIVNIGWIREMQPKSHGDYVILLKNDVKLTMSRRYRDRVFGKT